MTQMARAISAALSASCRRRVWVPRRTVRSSRLAVSSSTPVITSTSTDGDRVRLAPRRNPARNLLCVPDRGGVTQSQQVHRLLAHLHFPYLSGHGHGEL